MAAGSTRFNELRRGVPRMSPALLAKRLRDLEAAGIITRTPLAGEAEIHEYRLTSAGRDLKPVIEAIGIWGQKWVESEASLQKDRKSVGEGKRGSVRLEHGGSRN